jgi:subtilisin family serine protease
MKEFIVVAKSEADIDSIHSELTRDTSADPSVNSNVVPDRAVSVANARLGNPRITHYYLTNEEAERLCQDPRLEAVHQPPNPRAKVPHNTVQTPKAYDQTPGNFLRNTSQSQESLKYNVNWGLRRTCIGSTENVIGDTYYYEADGTGVDVVIIDDGIQVDHPEFITADGTSRVQQIDWYAATGIPGTMPRNHYKSINYGDSEHGTHVATTVAGKTFGYAKNSRIYSIRIFGDSNQVIPDYDIFDLVRVWHTRKPINPESGTRRPTIVNMSWGYAWYYSDGNFWYTNNIKSISFRGTMHNYPGGTTPQLQYGMRPEFGARHGLLVPSVDAEVADAAAVGIIFVHAAGNYSHKIDKPGGVDYNNYYTVNSYFGYTVPPGQPIYYHRGGSPSTTTTGITVGAADTAPVAVGRKLMERLAYYSERGPAVDIIAPGTDITAGTSKTASFGTAPYVWGKNLKRDTSHRVCKISGTSMASPQVTGVLALYLSRNPNASLAECKEWLSTVSKKNQVNPTTTNNDWSNLTAMLGGPNNYLYNPYHNSYADPSDKK